MLGHAWALALDSVIRSHAKIKRAVYLGSPPFFSPFAVKSCPHVLTGGLALVLCGGALAGQLGKRRAVDHVGSWVRPHASNLVSLCVGQVKRGQRNAGAPLPTAPRLAVPCLPDLVKNEGQPHAGAVPRCAGFASAHAVPFVRGAMLSVLIYRLKLST